VTSELSERSARFVLAGDGQEGPADAVLYLMRHLHRSDVQFLEAFHHSEVAEPAPINAIGILSRADEVGVGRADALASARQVAGRYRSDPQLRRLCQTVVPVAGLLASSGATLRQDEFASLQALAALGPGLDDLLLSADRFVRLPAPVEAGPRAALLERFGAFGIRLATTLLAGGSVRTAPELSDELVSQSGLLELRDLLLTRFAARRDVLKARAALAAIHSAIVDSTGGARDDLIAAVERVKAGAHEVTETQLLSEHRAGEVLFRPDEEDEVDRLLGLDGPEPTVRLGLGPDAGPDEIRVRLEESIQRWRRRSENPLTSREVADAARVLVRSCEGMLADLGAVAASS
jgi:hypothetical protein